MNRTVVPFCVAAFALVAQIACAAAFEQDAKVVFLGDSLTYQARWTKFLMWYYYEWLPERRVTFYNAGKGGDTMGGCLSRLDEDVIARKPDVVVIALGGNDVGGGLWAAKFGEKENARKAEILNRYEKNMQAVADKLKAACPKVRLVWCTPAIYDETAKIAKPADLGRNSELLAGCTEIIKRFGDARGEEVIDLNGPMTKFNAERQKQDPTFTLIGPDRVHPLDPGAFFIACEFLRQQGLDPHVGGDPLKPWAPTELSKKIDELVEAEAKLRSIAVWRYSLQQWNVNPDDLDAVKAYNDKLRAEGRRGYFEDLLPRYIQRLPRRAEYEYDFKRLQNEVLAAAFKMRNLDSRIYHGKWFNHYHDSIVYKIYMKSKNKEPVTTLDEALAIIKRIHDLSGGIHQIAYLVGWQFDGHDSKYPDWSEVGKHCASTLSSDPLESLRKAMKVAAQKYNTDLSLHINMNDAYTNAPSWNVYKENNLLCRKMNGELERGGFWSGERCYLVSHAKEWRAGFAQKRILGLLEMFPDLKRSGTIHIDAFFGIHSNGDGISIENDHKVLGEIVEFWHQQGVDVTTESFSARDQIGRIPMCYHINLDEQWHLNVPSFVLCGGDDEWNIPRRKLDYYHGRNGWMCAMPSAGSAYEEAWGIGSTRGDLKGEILKRPGALADRLFKTAILFCYYNKSEPTRHWTDADRYVVERGNGVVSEIRKADRYLTIKDNGRLVYDNGDCLLDFPHNGGTLLAYSRKGCDRVFKLPAAFANVRTLKGTRGMDGTAVELPVQNGTVTIKLPAHGSLVLGKGNEQ